MDNEMEHTQEKSIEQREVGVLLNGNLTTLVLRISPNIIDNERCLRIELSKPDNLSFLMYCDMDASMYQKSIKSQNVSSGFADFIFHFVSLVDRITLHQISFADPMNGLFSFSIELTEMNISSDHAYSFVVKQQSSFMSFALLSLPFRLASQQEQIQYLMQMIYEIRQNSISSEGKEQSIYSQRSEKYRQDLLSLQTQHVDSVSVLRSTFEQEISSLQTQIQTIEEEHEMTHQSNQHTWQEQMNVLQEQIASISQELLVVQGEKDEMIETIRVLREKATTVTTLSMNHTELTNELKSQSEISRKLQEELDSERHLTNELKQRSEYSETELKRNREHEHSLETQLHETESKLNELIETNNQSSKTHSASQLTISQQQLTIQTQQLQINNQKKDLNKYAEEVQTLTHSNKMKDRALSCLNQEINKIKMGFHYSSVL